MKENQEPKLAALPLKGVRVLDMSRHLPGPLCSLYLAQLGAEVIKLEDPAYLDPVRNGLIESGEQEASPLFEALNRGKRGMRIRLAEAEGRQRLRELVEGSDVFIESFRPGVADKIGCGYAALREWNYRIVYCSISGFGPRGGLSGLAGHDLNFNALSGLTHLFAASGNRSPLPVPLADIAGGAFSACIGVLAALVGRAADGSGRKVDVAMLDGCLSLAALASRLPKGPAGEEILGGALACYNIYETSDRRLIALAALEPKFWLRFCEKIERPDLVVEHFAPGKRQRRLKDEIAAIFRGATLNEWRSRLDGADCCFSAVNSPEEALSGREQGLNLPLSFDGSTAPRSSAFAEDPGEPA